MKKTYWLICFCLGLFGSLQAQDYAPFRATDEYFYLIDGTDELAAYRIDSVASAGADQILYNYPSFFVESGCNLLSNGWPGIVVEQSNAWKIINADGDSILLRTDLGMNVEWDFYTFPTNFIVRASITNASLGNVLGQPDSVLTIGFQYYNSVNIPLAHDVNDLEIKLSKTHGLVTAIDFHQFPHSLVQLNLVGGSAEHWGVRRLPQADYFERSIGDIFHYVIRKESYNGSTLNSFTDGWRKEEVVNIFQAGGQTMIDTKSEFWEEKQEVHSAPPVIITFNSGLETISTILNTESNPLYIPLPGEIFPAESPFVNGERIFYDSNEAWDKRDDRWYQTRHQNNFHKDTAMGGPCFYQSILSSLIDYQTTEYSEGLGITYYSLTSGEASFTVNSAEYRLVYYKKGSEEWGNVVGVNDLVSAEKEIKVYPNPTSGLVQLEMPEVLSLATVNIQLWSIDGRLLLEQKGQEPRKTLDLSNLPNGLYTLRIMGDNFVETQKLTVQH